MVEIKFTHFDGNYKYDVIISEPEESQALRELEVVVKWLNANSFYDNFKEAPPDS